MDGQMLMEKNREGLDYFFSSQLQQLEVALTYEQLRQIMQVSQTLQAATQQKRLARVRELEHSQQLALHSQFLQLFRRLPADLSPQDCDLLDSLSQKVLLEWTREEAVAAIKRERVEQALQEKRKTWLGFLSRNAPNLSQEDQRQIEAEVEKFAEAVDKQRDGRAVGFYLLIRSLQLSMLQPRPNQQLHFLATDIELHFDQQAALKLTLVVADSSLTYRDPLHSAALFKRTSTHGRLLAFELEDAPH